MQPLHRKVPKMISKWCIVLTCIFLAFCESAFVETLQKCAMDDYSCLKDLIKHALEDTSKNGIPEYGIPPTDPMNMANLKIPIYGLMTILIEEGEARGIKDCVIDKIESDVTVRRFAVGLICDLNIKAKFKVGDISPFIQETIRSQSVLGSGNAKVKLNKLHLNLQFLYDIVKKEDGDYYFKCNLPRNIFEYEIGDAKFFADKILIGDVDATQLTNDLLQNNLKPVLTMFGKSFFDVGFGVMAKILHTFLEKTPAKYLTTTDISPYLT